MNVSALAQLQYDNLKPAQAVRASKADPKDPKLYKACQDFEAIFIKEMLKSMKSTVNKSGMMDGGFAEEIYDDMLYDEYAQKMAKTAGFGITETLYRQLSNGIFK